MPLLVVRFRYPFLPTRLLVLGCNLYSERSRPMRMTSRGLLLLMGLVASTGLVREAGAQGITFQTDRSNPRYPVGAP